jgi:fumarate reductase subunit C
MSVRAETALWALQRVSAAVLGICVLVHLLTIVLAVQGGLSAAEILQRTRGSTGWASFYLLFVLAVAIHAPIGLRTVLRETVGWRGGTLDAAAAALAVLLAAAGWWAVAGLFA